MRSFYVALIFMVIAGHSWARSQLSSQDVQRMANLLTQVEEHGVVNSKDISCGLSVLDVLLTDSFSEDGADCSKFIADNGEFGDYGKILVEALLEKGRDSHLFADDRPGMEDSPYTCPAWKKLSFDMRLRFWVWTFAAIAWDESKCDARARNTQATNGVAVGLLQLDEARSARRWRGRNCEAKNVSAPRENLRCGVDIMEELMRGPDGLYKASGKLWGDTSYWQKLKKSANNRAPSTVVKRIKEFPACEVIE